MKTRSILTSAVLLAGIGWLATLSTVEAQPKTAASGTGESFTVDPVHSGIVFGINHLGVGYFYGRFNGPIIRG